jgi:hypothetical protein
LLYVKFQHEDIQFAAKLASGLLVDGGVQKLAEVEDLLAQLHLDGKAVGVLEYFVREPQVFRDETVVIELQRLSFAGQIIKQTICLSSLNSLFYNLVEEFHEQIVPGIAPSKKTGRAAAGSCNVTAPPTRRSSCDIER